MGCVQVCVWAGVQGGQVGEVKIGAREDLVKRGGEGTSGGERL